MKRRAAVEPTIGHLKSHYRLDRNRLKGTLGDALNVLFSAAAFNFSKLLRFVLAFCAFFSQPSCRRFLYLALPEPTSSGSTNEKPRSTCPIDGGHLTASTAEFRIIDKSTGAVLDELRWSGSNISDAPNKIR